jgi:hypothetical protein
MILADDELDLREELKLDFTEQAAWHRRKAADYMAGKTK